MPSSQEVTTIRYVFLIVDRLWLAHPTCVQGLKGCGTSTASGVVKYGLGPMLFKAVSAPDSSTALAAWRAELCDVLRTDPQQHIGSLRPAVASHIGDTFPTQEVLEAYTNPFPRSRMSR